MKNKTLIVDQDAMSRAKLDYAAQATDMANLCKDLTEAVENLKTFWDSDAGKEFTNKFEDSLKENMGRYQRVIEHMAQNMNTALSLYEEVFQESRNLQL